VSTDFKMAYSVKGLAEAQGRSPSAVRKDIREGKLEAVRYGRRVLITPEAARRWWDEYVKPYQLKSQEQEKPHEPLAA
jgi:hypothetical protein